jgi:hypothetical protein
VKLTIAVDGSAGEPESDVFAHAASVGDFMRLDPLEEINNFVHYVGDAAVLQCLRPHGAPMRYSELENVVSKWSNRRPSDSHLTHALTGSVTTASTRKWGNRGGRGRAYA